MPGHQHDLARLKKRTSQTGSQNVIFDLKRIGLIAIGRQHWQIRHAPYRLDRTVALDDIGFNPAPIDYLTFDVDRIIPNEFVARLYDERPHLDSGAIRENQRLIRNPRLFVNRGPFQSHKYQVANTDKGQNFVDHHRWRAKCLFIGLCLFLGNYCLLFVSVNRFARAASVACHTERGTCGCCCLTDSACGAAFPSCWLAWWFFESPLAFFAALRNKADATRTNRKSHFMRAISCLPLRPGVVWQNAASARDSADSSSVRSPCKCNSRRKRFSARACAWI